MEKQHHLEHDYGSGKNTKTLYYARVIDINDPLDSQRIRVRIKGLDDRISDEKLPWCDSFLPLMNFILPKRDELVKIILFNSTEPNMRRQWIGPVISQFQSLKFDGYLTALKNTDLSQQTPDKGVSNIPDAKGVYPEKDDIALLGRDNTDVLLKSNLVLIRAGKFVKNNNVTLNNTNPSYIHLRMSSDGKKSTAAMVADKIYLIAHEGATTYPAILTDKILEDIEKNADPAVLGNPLYEVLKLMIIHDLTHVHTSAEMPPNPGSGKYKELSVFDLAKILSKNIKIN